MQYNTILEPCSRRWPVESTQVTGPGDSPDVLPKYRSGHDKKKYISTEINAP